MFVSSIKLVLIMLTHSGQLTGSHTTANSVCSPCSNLVYDLQYSKFS